MRVFGFLPELERAGFVLELSGNSAILHGNKWVGPIDLDWGPIAGSRFLGTAASRERRQRRGQYVEVEFLQRAHDLSEVHGGFLLEFFRGL